MRALAAGGAPVERLDRWIDALVDVLAEHPHVRAPAAALALRGRRAHRRAARGAGRRTTTHPAHRRRRRGAAARRHRRRASSGRRASPHTLQTLIGATVYHFASGEFGDEMIGRPLFSASRGAPPQARGARRSSATASSPAPARSTRAGGARRWRTFSPSNRRKIGDFEVIEFVDETQIAALRDAARRRRAARAALDLGVRQRGRGAARALRARQEGPVERRDRHRLVDPAPARRVVPAAGRRLAAAERADRRWAPTRRPAARPRATSSPHLISQLLHGEQAALQLCGQLTNACPTMDQKWYAGSQVIDEVRHVEVFSKFLQRKMGVDLPDRPHAEGAARQAARRARPGRRRRSACRRCSRAWRSASWTSIQRANTNPLLTRHHPPRRAGRGAPRRLRHPHHAPRGEGVRRPRRWPRWRTSRSTSSRR